MLDVYMDEKMLTEWVRKYNHRNDRIGLKIREFIRYNCNLFLDKQMNASGYHSQILTTFLQNAKESPKPKFKEIDESLSKSAKCWSVFLLKDTNQTISGVKNLFITANENELDKVLSELLFIREGQQKTYLLVPNHLRDTIENKNILFDGWKSLTDDKLIPFSNIVILDPFFLEPVNYSNPKDADFDLNEHIELCIKPLINSLTTFSIAVKFNLTVFAGYKSKESSDNAKAILESINMFLKSKRIAINFTIVIPYKLDKHKRYFYTNYFGLNLGSSVNTINNDSILGDKDEEIHIYPYSEESLNEMTHQSSLITLNQLYNKIFEKGTRIFPSQRPESVVNCLLTDAFEFCKPKSQN